ncbi:MAG: efflux RND transporter periplasmic adaptor subunit [Xanthomonadales bacterium]|nr:efflux RND transporter periplasmic adaptor subunit [Xanthomonadales bacterium]
MNSILARYGALVALALLVSGCSGDPGEPDEEYHQQVEALAIERNEQLEIEREFAGLVLPRQSSDIGFELAGKIVALAVDEGDRVEPGQLIASLDKRLLESERDELRAQKDELQARLELNEANLKRALDLQEKGFAADQEIDELNAEKKTLQANMARVEAALVANQDRLDKSELFTPFGGAVSRRFVDVGSVVASGAPVFRVIEEATLEARIGVPVRLVNQLKPGDTIPILAAGKRTQGEIITVGSDVTRATLTVPVRIGISAKTGAIPGDQAYAVMRDEIDRAGFWLPASAVTDGLRGLWVVYVPVADPEQPGLFHLESRDVRVLYADDERVFVAGALATGENVVTGGLQRLVPGQKVRLKAGEALARSGEAPPP